MRVFVAGASGAVGRRTVSGLVGAGHDVVGMTRHEARTDELRQLGATPVVADALDTDAVAAAVEQARPEVIVHQLTAIGGMDTRHFDRSLAMTSRLRVHGTDNLMAAGRAVGVRRVVAQSVAAFGAYARVGVPIKTEDDPLDEAPARSMRGTIDAVRHLEAAVLGASWTTGLVLRYGAFYGPGTALTPGGGQLEMIRRRRFPVVGDGAGVWSFVHVDDAAEACVAAVQRGAPGAYNIVDDEPATVAEWVPELARQLSARPPLRVPAPVGRLLAGEAGLVLMTQVRGASNDRAREELGWRPAHRTWRETMAR